jgi:hypothetical protein
VTSFAMDIKGFAERAGDAADLVVRTVCLDLFSDITMNTPVDTGRARANWFASVGMPISTSVEYTGNPASASGEAIGNAQAAVAQAPGNVFWISNNLPYIYRLEFEGWSKQAPNGMVRLAIDRAQRAMR